MEIAGASNMMQLVTLREIDPSDYSWNPLTDERPYSVGYLDGTRYPEPQNFTGWAVEPYTFTDIGGNPRRPGILVKADGDLDDVEFVRIQVRRTGTSTVLTDQVKPYGNPATNPDPLQLPIEFSGILPNTAYEVRGLLEPYSGRDTNWSSWLAVTTPDVRLGTDDFWPINLDGLATQVRDIQAWLGDSIRDVLDWRAEIDAAIADAMATNFAVSQTIRTEISNAYQDTRARYTDAIVAATGPGSALVARVTSLEVAVGTLASASAVSALTVRVTAAEDNISTLSASVTSLTTTVAGKADASTVTALSSTVTAQGNTITSQGTAITALQNTVNDPTTGLAAVNTAVSGLQTDLTTVTTTVNGKNRVFRQGTAPSATAVGDLWINTADNNKLYRASAVGTGSWVLSDDQRIPQLVTDVAANTSAITALQTNYNDVSANATFRMGTGYTPGAGYTARIGLEARINSGATFRAAGLYIDVTSSTARLVLSADQVAILAGGTLAALFDAGTAYIANARIRNLDATNITAAKIDAAQILQNGTLITDLIAANAVSAETSDTVTTPGGAGQTFTNGAWSDFVTISIANPSGRAVQLGSYLVGSINGSNSGTGRSYGQIEYRVMRGSTQIRGLEGVFRTTAAGTVAFVMPASTIDDPGAPSGNLTYTLQIRLTTDVGGCALISGIGFFSARAFKK